MQTHITQCLDILYILNRGNRPNFVIIRKVVIDINLSSIGLINEIKDWHVSTEPKSSGRRYIRLTLQKNEESVREHRDNRDSYKEDSLRVVLGLPNRIRYATERKILFIYVKFAALIHQVAQHATLVGLTVSQGRTLTSVG